MTKTEALEALTKAHQAPFTRKTGAFGGCGRVYVSVSGCDRATVTAIAAAAKKLGLIFQRKAHYGLRNAIYIGYDNADGNAIAKGEVFAESLKASGIQAYSDAFGD